MLALLHPAAYEQNECNRSANVICGVLAKRGWGWMDLRNTCTTVESFWLVRFFLFVSLSSLTLTPSRFHVCAKLNEVNSLFVFVNFLVFLWIFCCLVISGPLWTFWTFMKCLDLYELSGLLQTFIDFLDFHRLHGFSCTSSIFVNFINFCKLPRFSRTSWIFANFLDFRELPGFSRTS